MSVLAQFCAFSSRFVLHRNIPCVLSSVLKRAFPLLHMALNHPDLRSILYYDIDNLGGEGV
ncbi:hypothetical protein ETA_05020 [Erwinia tasmaniensis Et1/99]|uniref:Uncharacterized protein n=1 Tax=Erwinia tasmaniensis (strain DSM 17950 / CFBP 7177 / CIP 109463 / NCPPB 4357 / Et1/99) TaxID=465817 RepID=B2VGD2_ERWT9|nr:hypothetical protein ETA_05020 [Erwinia tasmaniensis Et1/99]